jgi:addiction module HigA family antidote
MHRIRTHPGEILSEEFLKPLNMSARGLAELIGVPGNRISDIVRARRDMTVDTALRLALFFGTSPEFWMNAQVAHDLSKARALNDYSKIKARCA